VTTAGKIHKFFVREMGHHLAQTGVGSEEVLANVCTIFNRQTLKLAIHCGVQFIQQNSVNIARK
jgi:hypothetical protein